MKITPAELLDRLGLEYLPKSNRLAMLCPWHDDRNPSSGFYLDTELFFCFSCELTLDMPAFYAKYRNTSRVRAIQALGLSSEEEKKETIDLKPARVFKKKAESKLGQARGRLSMEEHALLGELIDKIYWAYARGKLTQEQLEGASRRWFRRVEEGSSSGI